MIKIEVAQNLSFVNTVQCKCLTFFGIEVGAAVADAEEGDPIIGN